MSLYLIKRGPRPSYHRAPFHPVILCAKKPVAKWEAGWTGDKAWVWTRETHEPYGGWLLERWEGLDIDYGHIVRGCTLPDGTETAFWHKHARSLPWDLMKGAIWWDDKKMPDWVQKAGVVYPPDDFTQDSILNTIANEIRGEHCSFPGRPRPEFWPKGLTLEEWDALQAASAPMEVPS